MNNILMGHIICLVAAAFATKISFWPESHMVSSTKTQSEIIYYIEDPEGGIGGVRPPKIALR